MKTELIELWYERIIDAMEKLEYKGYEPNVIVLPRRIIEAVCKRFPQFAEKGIVNHTSFMGMKIKGGYPLTHSKIYNKFWYNKRVSFGYRGYGDSFVKINIYD